MSRHPSPASVQRCHRNPKVIAPPDHSPSLTPRTSPTRLPPASDGMTTVEGGPPGVVPVGVVSVGAGSTGGAALTTADRSDATRVEPPASVAVTTTRTLKPTSAASSTYCASTAPAMSTQVPPSPVHRCHCRVNSARPLHVPSSALRSSPAVGVPVTTGEPSAVGGVGAGSAGAGAVVAVTTSDAVEAASPAPVESLAVTTTRTVEPASSSTSG